MRLKLDLHVRDSLAIRLLVLALLLLGLILQAR